MKIRSFSFSFFLLVGQKLYVALKTSAGQNAAWQNLRLVLRMLDTNLIWTNTNNEQKPPAVPCPMFGKCHWLQRCHLLDSIPEQKPSLDKDLCRAKPPCAIKRCVVRHVLIEQQEDCAQSLYAQTSGLGPITNTIWKKTNVK